MPDDRTVTEGSSLLRIATWNLERPRLTSTRRIAAQLACIASIDAALWILTETSDAIDLSATHPHHAASSPLQAIITACGWSSPWAPMLGRR